VSLFCRHNRFVADCPICSKGTVLERDRRPARRSPGAAVSRRKAPDASPAAFSGRYVSAGPYDDEEGASYEVRLERVPGGIRLAEWGGSGLRRRAPVLAAADVADLLAAAGGVLDGRDGSRLEGVMQAAGGGALPDRAADQGGDGADARPGVSRGRSGDFKEELRVEAVGEGRVRIGRWVLRPGSGWQLQEAPPMLPAERFAEALEQAAVSGVVPCAPDAGDAAQP